MAARRLRAALIPTPPGNEPGPAFTTGDIRMPLSDLSIVPAGGTWVVRAGGAVIGESERAFELVEGEGAPVIYFPPDDLGMAFLEGTETTTASRTLGSARFFSIVTGAGIIEDAAWSYATPLHGAERIAGLIAFDSRLVAVEEV